MAVDEPRTEDLAEFEPVLAQARSGETSDPFRARLEVEFTAGGSLGPDTPITIWLEGTATTTITGGQVEVVLPTIAAMALATPDKPLRYPTGEKLPVVGQWQLPAMDAGSTWRQSIEIAGVPNGYYQIAVNVLTRGPGRSPYLLDEVYGEVWMHVDSTAGRLTAAFDASVFPDNLAPQPGPARVRAKHQAVASADHVEGVAALAATASSSGDPIYVQVLYNNISGNMVPAVDVRIHGEYFNQGDEWPVQSLERTVPSSGVVSFPCTDDDFQIIEGWAYTPTTAEVYGGHPVVGYWDAVHDQCGDTLHLTAGRHYYIPWKYLDAAAELIEDHFDYSRSRVTFVWEGGSGFTSYDSGTDLIKYRKHYDSPWTSAHEFVHALHEESLGGIWGTSNCDSHYTDSVSSYSCALSEGLADYGGDIGAPGHGFGWEHWPKVVRDDGVPAEIEGNVAATIHDLIDPNNEGDDDTTYPPYYVMTIIRTCRTPSSQLDATPDFIWCLERLVNDDVHDEHFPGISAPSSVTESATEPPSWNRDDIRSTWLKSMSNN